MLSDQAHFQLMAQQTNKGNSMKFSAIEFFCLNRGLKSVLLLCCLCLHFSVGLASAESSTIRFADTGMIVIKTPEMFGSVVLSEGEIPSSSGEMLLVLSSEEVVEFKKGELTGYFCGEEELPERTAETRCRAKVANSHMWMATGGRHHGDPKKEYQLRLLGLDPQKKEYALQSIDGTPVEVTYGNGKFVISTRRDGISNQ